MRGAGAGGAGAPRQPWKAVPAEDQPDQAGRPGGLRKKAAGVRAWLAVDAAGQAEVVEVGKHAIMRRTGLPARDLRILDPQLSYPSTVLGRERAIVINLEHIKAIITAQEVLLLNSRDPSFSPFAQELQRRLHSRHATTDHNNSSNQKGRLGSDDANWANVLDEPPKPRNESPPLINSGSFSSTADAEDKGKATVKPSSANSVGPRVLPFEFIALEACLEAACRCLENETRKLEHEAHPALDKLTSKISTLNLERVRQIKSRLVAITGRVQKVRDELEHLLDDDDDMDEMYLTEKLIQQRFSDGSSCRSSFKDGGDGMDDGRIPDEISLETNDVQKKYEHDLRNIGNQDHLLDGQNMLNGDSHRTQTGSTRSGSKHLDVEELEMLLEAYFVQVDGTLNKLSTLREYVDDTEDYINIMLDDKQNHLLQMGVVLTTATLVVPKVVDFQALQHLPEALKKADLHKLQSELLTCLPSMPNLSDLQRLRDELKTSLPSMDILPSLSGWHLWELLTNCLPQSFSYSNHTDVCVLRTVKEDVANLIAPLLVRPISRWPFFVFLAGAMFCLLASSTCHLLSCHSRRLSYIMLRIDYAGISALIATSFYPPVYYSFLCDPFFCNLYLGFITILGIATVTVSLIPVFQNPEYRAVRAGLFFGMGVSGIVPVLHKLVVFRHRPEAIHTTGYEILMGVLYGLGALVYATRIPERWMPGRFDIAGHSHQLFHVLVVAGAYTHYHAGLVYLKWRDLEGC